MPPTLMVPSVGTKTKKACSCGCQNLDEHRRNWDVRAARSALRYGRAGGLKSDSLLCRRLDEWLECGMLPADIEAALMKTDNAALTPTTLYRLRGAAGLLYIGIGGNPGRRFEQHKSRFWWGDVVSVDLEHFPTRKAALNAESKAIRREAPLHNKTYNEGATP